MSQEAAWFSRGENLRGLIFRRPEREKKKKKEKVLGTRKNRKVRTPTRTKPSNGLDSREHAERLWVFLMREGSGGSSGRRKTRGGRDLYPQQRTAMPCRHFRFEKNREGTAGNGEGAVPVSGKGGPLRLTGTTLRLNNPCERFGRGEMEDDRLLLWFQRKLRGGVSGFAARKRKEESGIIFRIRKAP